LADLSLDSVFVLSDPNLVRPFCNRLVSCPPDDFLVKNFERGVETVKVFNDRVQSLPILEAQREIQSVSLSGFSDGKVGMYANFHDGALWKVGYGKPETIRLAHMYEVPS
jgi:hypothetical protein